MGWLVPSLAYNPEVLTVLLFVCVAVILCASCLLLALPSASAALTKGTASLHRNKRVSWTLLEREWGREGGGGEGRGFVKGGFIQLETMNYCLFSWLPLLSHFLQPLSGSLLTDRIILLQSNSLENSLLRSNVMWTLDSSVLFTPNHAQHLCFFRRAC